MPVPQRYQITKPTYMPLDGQWQIVYPGTVFDAPDSDNYHTTNATKLSPSEPAATLGSHGKPTAVRNVRTR